MQPSTQALPPTDAEQCAALRTANALLRGRVAELEGQVNAGRTGAEKLMECYHEAAADAARFHEALSGLHAAVWNAGSHLPSNLPEAMAAARAVLARAEQG